MISFELHLEKWHEKTQKPLWFLGFPNRYLFRFAMLASCTEKDIIVETNQQIGIHLFVTISRTVLAYLSVKC